MADFGIQVAAYVKKYKKRLRAIAKESVQETIALAQVPTGDGGRMRIDTGFLRASIAANVGSMPIGDSVNTKESVTYEGTALSAALLEWNPELGETIFVGWTANYARYREYEDGFLRGAVEQWDGIVASVAARVKAKI